MQRVTRSTAVASQPAAPPSPGLPGFFTGGNPGVGLAATVPGYEWFNAVQEELVALVLRSGLALDAADQAQVRRSLERLCGGGLRTLTANTVLTADDAGLLLVDASGGNRTHTLPAANAAAGRPIRLTLARTDASSNTVALARAGADTIEGATSLGLRAGDRMGLVSDGVSAWRIVSDAPQGRSLTSPGWARLPGGLVLQWGAGAIVPANSSIVVTLPVAMPAAFVAVVLGAELASSGGGALSAGWALIGLSQFRLSNPSASILTQTTWLAIGF